MDNVKLKHYNRNSPTYYKDDCRDKVEKTQVIELKVKLRADIYEIHEKSKVRFSYEHNHKKALNITASLP